MEQPRYLKKDAVAMTEKELIGKVVKKNLGLNYTKDFILQSGDQETSLKGVKKVLRKIERAHGMEKQLQKKQKLQQQLHLKQDKTDGEKEPKKEEPGPRPKNMCGVHNKTHEWKDCPNNPHSTNFNGTSYKEILKKRKAAAEAAEMNAIGATKKAVSFLADFEYNSEDDIEESDDDSHVSSF